MATTEPVIGGRRVATCLLLFAVLPGLVAAGGQHQPEARQSHLKRQLGRRHVPQQAASDNSSSQAADAMRRCQQSPPADPQANRLLAKHFRLPGDAPDAPDGHRDARAPLPRPRNVSVLIISWYPPVLKLSWDLDEPHSLQPGPLSLATNKSVEGDDYEDVDVNLEELAGSGHLEPAPELEQAARQQQQRQQQQQQQQLLQELRLRQLLLKKALTCFQVTYNIINSRFKVSEEYPAYLRSVLLERLLPATEYSLQVSAVYLEGRYRLASDRVQFVSPADNESRRFKENTYRPVHRYPDEADDGSRVRGRSRLGALGQVRSEELTLVAIALLFWVATICLFFNKWGKIRMLEPYQPAYREACLGVEGVVEPVVEPVAAYASLHQPSLHNLGVSAGAKLGGSGAAGDHHGSVSLAGSERSSQTACGCGNQQGEPAAKNSLATGKSQADQLPLLAAGKRTEAELQFLFQAKAQQLAKATGFWARSQQQQQHLSHTASAAPLATGHQRHRQQQYRAQHVDLEMLRRTSQALLRQRQQSVQCGGGAAAAQQPTGAQSKGCAGKIAQLGSAERPSGWPHALAHSQNPAAGSPPAPAALPKPAQSCDLPQRGDGSSLAASNKLRRLLFISRSHRHHHVATSSSSVSSSQPATNARQSADTVRASSSATASRTKPGSLSLDAAEPAGGPHLGLHRQHHHRAKHRQPSTESAPAAHLQQQPQPQQHHILIEPPSPPRPRDLLESREPEPAPGSLSSEESLAGCWTTGASNGDCPIVGPSGATSSPGLQMGSGGRQQMERASHAETQRQRLLSWAGDGGRDNEFGEPPPPPPPDSSDHDNHYSTARGPNNGGASNNNNNNNNNNAEPDNEATQHQPAICLEEAPSLQPSPQLTPTVSAEAHLAQWGSVRAGSRCRSAASVPAAAAAAAPAGRRSAPGGPNPKPERDAFQELAAYQCEQRGWCLAGRRGCLGASMQLPAALGSQSSLLLLNQCAPRHQSFGAPSQLRRQQQQQRPAGAHNQLLELGGRAEPARPRISSVFVASPYSRAHRDSFAMLRALSQKKSKSAEDVAYLSQLVLQIWARDRNPLLQSASQQQLSQPSEAQAGAGNRRQSQERHQARRPKSSLTVAHM